MNDNHQLQTGITMRRALLAHAASAGGNLVPREAEFFEAGYAASASAPANDWCPECHALNSVDQADGLDMAQIAALISRYTSLRKASDPREFAELERLVCAAMLASPPSAAPAGTPPAPAVNDSELLLTAACFALPALAYAAQKNKTYKLAFEALDAAVEAAHDRRARPAGANAPSAPSKPE